MKRLWLGILLGGMFLMGGSLAVSAAQSSSTNYNVNEVQFGAGSRLNSSSNSYRAQQSLGATAGGTTKSASYWAQAGYLTPNTPFLELAVDPADIDLGTLSSTTAATGTATFRVRAYVNSGYAVLAMNDPPVNESGDFMDAAASASASTPGTEQFGINLAQNQTSCPTPAPANFGANPVLVPDSTYANGQAATGYETCGLFKYVKGDIIAESSGNGWGQTNFTISYIFNIATLSEAGRYTMSQDLVAVATY